LGPWGREPLAMTGGVKTALPIACSAATTAAEATPVAMTALRVVFSPRKPSRLVRICLRRRGIQSAAANNTIETIVAGNHLIQPRLTIGPTRTFIATDRFSKTARPTATFVAIPAICSRDEAYRRRNGATAAVMSAPRATPVSAIKTILTIVPKTMTPVRS